MFNKNSRHISRQVNEEVDIRLQLSIWTLIDILKDKVKVELDYLQIFKLKKEGNLIRIEHEQEVPKYRSVHLIEAKDIQLDEAIKVYVIDDGEYSTMIFPSEYWCGGS